MRQPLGQARWPSGHQWRSVALRALVFVVIWLVVAVPLSVLVFLNSSKTTVLASHDAVVRPTLDGYATLDLGPYLPNLRYPSGHVLGAAIDLGKTNLTTYSALIQRYAFIGSQPEGQIAKLQHTLVDLAVDSAITGGTVALILPAGWFLLGRRRRAELFGRFTVRRSATVGLAAVVVLVAVAQPWNRSDDEFTQGILWQSIGSALPDVPIPEAAQQIQIEGGLMTSGTKRLAASAFDTYTKSLNFYNDAADAAQALGPLLRQPAEDETVVLLVSDRHDNIGMDKVARAVADAGGATALFDAGDDTSTGSSWEAFSLESLNSAFSDVDDRYAISGNHDHGDFVSTRLSDLGFTHLEGEVIDGPGGIRLLGLDDPRSSGLGSWRDTPGISFDEYTTDIAEIACEHQADGDRLNTLLVHDANSGDEALARGCVDLVLGGHIHTQLGPTRVVGENGVPGYSYTNGTTGGAAYALAIGSKLRRNAEVTLVTYRDGRPVGLQPVLLRTTGTFRVREYLPLDLGAQPQLSVPDPTGNPTGSPLPGAGATPGATPSGLQLPTTASSPSPESSP